MTKEAKYSSSCALRMSGEDALEELELSIQEALQEEQQASHARPRLDAYSQKFSVRDLSQQVESNHTDGKVSRTELLESWQSLVQALSSTRVFLQYTPQLERYFVSTGLDDDSDWEEAKTLLDLMTETIRNHDKDESTECRYVTLMEVLTTYDGGHNWRVSQQAQRLWEAQDQYVDDPDSIEPEEFRQMAYGVLMLLPWVPNSVGLRQACSIPDDESLDEEHVPSAVESIFDQIRSRPLPRHDAVHRILSHLETQDNATVAISSTVSESFQRGIGITTMAALVASSPQARDDYDVLWLRLNHQQDKDGGMTYRKYVGYLNDLCDQLGVEREWPKPMRVLEERALQKKREEEKMFQLKNEMAELLRDHTSDLLLIIDDVEDDQDIEWFRFLERQAMVVTTRSHNLSVTWTLNVELLTEEESVQLFLTEGNFDVDDAIGNSLEAKSIVQRCGYHPLTIRMVARWFSLKEATAGVIKALEELDQELSTCTAKLRHSQAYKGNGTESILSEVMNLTLSPVLAAGGHPTSLMKICLSSMAVVFEQSVPRDVVMLLWGELLRTEPQAVAELGENLSDGKVRRRTRFIMDALLSLGILVETENDGEVYVEISHESQLDYAKSLAKEIHFGADETETVERWHNAFVNAYLSKKDDNELDALENICEEYAVEKLAMHMIRARKFKKATKLLSDARFLVERFTAKDFETGARLHLDDCKALLAAMESDGDSHKDPFEIVAAIYTKVASFMISEAKEEQDEEVIHQVGMAIHDLAFALAENGFSPEAVSQYKSALKVVPKRSQVSAILLYGMGALNMIRNEHSKALKNLNECLKGMVENGITGASYSEALLLKGDALFAECDYDEAMQFYDKSLDALLGDSINNSVAIAIAIFRKGMLHYVRGEHDKALRALGDSIDLKLKISESSANLATIYYFVGHILAERNQNDEAIEYFEKALHMMKENLDEVDNADIFLTTGKLCELRDDIDGCLDAFDLAIKEIRDVPRMEMDRAVHDYRTIARVSSSLGDFVGALPIFDEGLELTDDRPKSLERASLLFDLALCEFEEGEHEESIFHLQEALKIRKDKLKASEVVIQTFEKLGSTYLAMGKPEEALLYYEDALEYTEESYGGDNESVASLLFLLGDLKISTNDKVEALANFEECLEMRRRNLEITSVLIAETLERIGSIYIEQGKFDKAYPCYAESLDIRQASSEPDNPILAESFFRIGLSARKQGDCERALHFLMDALRIREKQQEEREMCETLLEIGNVHRQLMDLESAKGCYEKCLEIVHESYGKSDAMAGDILLALGQVHRSNGEVSRALECFDEGKSFVIVPYIDTQRLLPSHAYHSCQSLGYSYRCLFSRSQQGRRSIVEPWNGQVRVEQV